MRAGRGACILARLIKEETISLCKPPLGIEVEEIRMIISTNLQLADDPLTIRHLAERRAKPRIRAPFPVMVRGVDAKGVAFEVNTILDNLSAGGLYLRLARRVEPGAEVSMEIRLSTAPTDGALRAVTRGVVLRVEPNLGGACGAAVRFTRHQLLYRPGESTDLATEGW